MVAQQARHDGNNMLVGEFHGNDGRGCDGKHSHAGAMAQRFGSGECQAPHDAMTEAMRQQSYSAESSSS